MQDPTFTPSLPANPHERAHIMRQRESDAAQAEDRAALAKGIADAQSQLDAVKETLRKIGSNNTEWLQDAFDDVSSNIDEAA